MADANLSKEEQIAALRAEIDRLNGALVIEQQKNEDAQRRAAFFSTTVEEIPTGRFVTRKMALRPWEKDEDDQQWGEYKVPTFMYKIDMPAVGGVDLKLNGEPYQHGQVYELDLYQLRAVKEIIFRLQAHEASIHGNDDDVYRPRVSKEINLRTGTIRNLPVNWVPGIPVRQ